MEQKEDVPVIRAIRMVKPNKVDNAVVVWEYDGAHQYRNYKNNAICAHCVSIVINHLVTDVLAHIKCHSCRKQAIALLLNDMFKINIKDSF